MLIFNTTYVVSDKAHAVWLTWVKEQHIPFMLESSYLSHPQVARVISSAEQGGTSFSVQFQVQDMRTLKLWHKEYNLLFQEKCSQQFGTEVIFFTTVLEIVE